MDYLIRKIEPADKDEVFSMMETFYSSDAVMTNGSSSVFNNDIDACLKESPYLDGFVFVLSENILGYAMIAKSFSTEFGTTCIWLEDLYLKPEYRGLHIIPDFIKYIEKLYPNAVLRLEAEKENVHAYYVYTKAGFEEFPYTEMIKFCKK